MADKSEPSLEHHVGVTNAQENNPDLVLADLTRRMNAKFREARYAEAGAIALEITARNKHELAAAFQRHGVTVLHLDHEAFGIYEGAIEPTYDVHVDGRTEDVVAAGAEFGKRHAQEMVLIARKLKPGESDPNQCMGLAVTLNAEIGVAEAVEIAEIVRACGFQGATFAPKGNGAVIIYHTENLGLSPVAFQKNGKRLIGELTKLYALLQYRETFHILILVQP